MRSRTAADTATAAGTVTIPRAGGHSESSSDDEPDDLQVENLGLTAFGEGMEYDSDSDSVPTPKAQAGSRKRSFSRSESSDSSERLEAIAILAEAARLTGAPAATNAAEVEEGEAEE